MIPFLIIMMLWFGDTMTVVKPESLKRAVEEYVRNQYRGSAQTIIVEFRALPNGIAVSDAGYSFRVAPEGSARLSGNVSLPVEIVVKDKVERRVLVPFKVRTFANVIMASKQMQQHALITKDNVEMQTVETTLLPQDIVTSFEVLTEKRSSRIISQGSILRESMIESVPLVQQNETVTLIVKSKGVEVTTKALAKENGYRGEFILVQKMETRETLKAKVVNNKLVQLDIY
ncbi:MAG: flagellar basal body P-ring formation protein FlgA [Ignavibacteriales bacterium]|nr:flagellar basal body P-ring formation protein FlgA [Ignavibacteriales bacterium]